MQINIGTTRKSKIYRISACKCLIHMTPGDHLEREIPSKCRTRVTQRLKEALALVDVRTLDHIIVGDEATTSFAERGLL